MTHKRGNGEGTVFRRKNGGWGAAMTLPDGRRKYYYGATREEVRRKLGGGIHAQDTGVFTDARGATVGAFLDQWLADASNPRSASGRTWDTRCTSGSTSSQYWDEYR